MHFTRTTALLAGLGLTAGLLLAGCTSDPGGSATATTRAAAPTSARPVPGPASRAPRLPEGTKIASINFEQLVANSSRPIRACVLDRKVQATDSTRTPLVVESGDLVTLSTRPCPAGQTLIVGTPHDCRVQLVSPHSLDWWQKHSYPNRWGDTSAGYPGSLILSVVSKPVPAVQLGC
ncbi:MAG TPA: hypothetical protein VMT30_07000 [Candidatus Saccharimonadia bacterium]|nr:hypothetical protein [Candidatus Saccharimonadia bacterium]